jgi:hypothetical protein
LRSKRGQSLMFVASMSGHCDVRVSDCHP